MEYKEKDIKQGIKLHMIKTDKFKTNLIAIFLTTKLERETVTKNALISSLLRRGSMDFPSQEEISKMMEDMYGASFDCGIDKTGDNQVLKFYVDTINDNFLPENIETNGKGKLLQKSLETLFSIVFNPYIEEDGFKEEYFIQEKNNMKLRIESKIDNKARYAQDRCVEEMYKDEPFGLYRYGYVEDLEKINRNDLYKYYKDLIDNCKIDIFISGNIGNDTEDIINKNEIINNLKQREPYYNVPNTVNKKLAENEKVVTDKMNVTQGKLILGLDIKLEKAEDRYDVLIYNSILGGTANSKMFQNVREKAHLAYVASSSYLRYKSNIFVNCGIEIGNYDKALELIRKQIKDMKNGNFTEEDIENAKKGIIATIKTIDDEQDTCITYYFGQEISGERANVDDYIYKIENVKKDDIIKIANNVKINTIYFLRD